MKRAIPVFFVFSMLIAAFYFMRNKKNDPNRYVNFEVRLIAPFDSSRVLKVMKIKYEVNEISSYLIDVDGSLFPKIDTIDLVDMHWTCDCPNWRYADSTKQNFSSQNDFYIEPANEKLKLFQGLINARIQFIGREYGGVGYPKSPEFEDPNPPPGRVFKYYDYKIYKPFTVYRPNIVTKDKDDYNISTLTIKQKTSQLNC